FNSSDVITSGAVVDAADGVIVEPVVVVGVVEATAVGVPEATTVGDATTAGLPPEEIRTALFADEVVGDSILSLAIRESNFEVTELREESEHPVAAIREKASVPNVTFGFRVSFCFICHSIGISVTNL
ncbi:MAG: hypothetical protein AAB425_01815, partial [Bdellovibrionota bacterium]